MNLLKLYLEDLKNESDSEFVDGAQNGGTSGTAPPQSASRPVTAKAGGCTTECTKGVPEPTDNLVQSPETTLEIEDEAILMERMVRWVDGCRVGDEWKIPKSLLRKSHGIQRMADNCARNSRTGIRIWKIKENYLTCCTWSRRFEDLSHEEIESAKRNQSTSA